MDTVGKVKASRVSAFFVANLGTMHGELMFHAGEMWPKLLLRVLATVIVVTKDCLSSCMFSSSRSRISDYKDLPTSLELM